MEWIIKARILENYNIQHAKFKTLDQYINYKENSDVDFSLQYQNTKKLFLIDDNLILSDWPCVELNDGKLKARLLVRSCWNESIANIDSLGSDYNSHAVVATLYVD
ncbi:hypothetical protein C1645_753564 [Glomus cerebriforme]|uniref:Uncharacterized protein n=1 Tax=Glomus cerebriforme TaxID=658196 RepID=A0A397TKL1_9GLOM|nr:hypothetical protein C1645_753564 [Glomus cerebriforme]